MGTKRGKKLPVGIRINKHKSGSATIYVAFTFKGVECREPLSNRPVDDSNIEYAKNLRAEIKRKIKDGVFKYADYFPDSEKLSVFGGAKSINTLSDYLENFIIDAERRGSRPSTLTTYKSRKKVIQSYWPNTKVHNISLADIRDLAIKMYEDGKSYTTIRNCFKALKNALDDAVVDNAIQFNPMASFKLSKYVQKPKETDEEYEKNIDPFNLKELHALEEACRDEREQLLLKIWVKTGLRTGELCALKWSHVNLKRGYIKIRDNYVTMVAREGATKTASGTREIDLDDETLELFADQRRLTGLTGELVFQNPRSTNRGGYDGKSLWRWFTRLCKDANVRYRYSYQLRHTFATIKISQNTNLWELAEMLGHTSPEMLYRHYGSFIKEYQDRDSIFVKKTSHF